MSRTLARLRRRERSATWQASASGPSRPATWRRAWKPSRPCSRRGGCPKDQDAHVLRGGRGSAMKGHGLSKLYDTLTLDERFRLRIRALARRDWADGERLDRACLSSQYRAYCDRLEASDVLTL